VEKFSGLRASELDWEDSKEEEMSKLEERRREGWYATSHCEGDEHEIEMGRRTLFHECGDARYGGGGWCSCRGLWIFELLRARCLDLLHCMIPISATLRGADLAFSNPQSSSV